MKHLLRSCPVCNHSQGELLHSQLFVTPSNSPLPNEYDVVACINCGFVFADTPVNQTIYNNYYTQLSKYEDLEIASGGGNEKFDYNRLSITASTISRILPDHSASILDMGCANGGLLKSLKQIGYINILGIDPSKTCNTHVAELGINCIEGDLFSESFYKLSKKFDCIILTHVLEHIYDISTAIENLRSKLNNDGVLYIETPNASCYGDYYISPFYYIDCEHINHFDSNSLHNLITNRGFKQIETRNIELKVSDTHNYPAVYSIFRINKEINRPNYKYSLISKESFLKFVQQSKNNNQNDTIISRFVQTQEPIIIWGAGQFTMRLLANTSLRECNIIGIIDSDSNKQGKFINGYIIFSPDKLKNSTESIIICSVLHSEQIIDQIISLNSSLPVYVMK